MMRRKVVFSSNSQVSCLINARSHVWLIVFLVPVHSTISLLQGNVTKNKMKTVYLSVVYASIHSITCYKYIHTYVHLRVPVIRFSRIDSVTDTDYFLHVNY